LLSQIEPQTERTRTLFDIEPMLLSLETNSVTAATEARRAVRELGYTVLFSDAELTMLWGLRLEPVSEPAVEAFTLLGAGKEHEAFFAFGKAAAQEPPYFIHTAVLAERLFARNALSPTALMPMRIEFRKCDETYKVEWAFGALGRLSEEKLPREFAAETALRRAFRCGAVIADTDDAGTLKTEYAKWRRRFAGTHAEARYRLRSLDRMAAVADRLSSQGRLIQGNELRAFIYQETLDERPYRFLGGITQARELRARVRGYLAFPPEPEVHLNDPQH
jgi:hypothetical protein